MLLHYTEVSSPVGKLILAANSNALVAILWENDKPNRVKLGPLSRKDDLPILMTTTKELSEYFEGKRKSFSLSLVCAGTPFQMDVWAALQEIPYGITLSYSEIANRIGRPKAVRAVGTAIGKNPISIIIPCHRVIGSDGSLTGFAGGLDKKKTLLDLEKL